MRLTGISPSIRWECLDDTTPLHSRRIAETEYLNTEQAMLSTHHGWIRLPMKSRSSFEPYPESILPEFRMGLSRGPFSTIPPVATIRGSPYQVTPLTLLIIALRIASASIDRLEQKRNAITKPDFRSDTAHADLIIIDEPFENLDPEAIRTVLEILGERHGEGSTIIVASHIVGGLEKLATHVAILVSGRLVEYGESVNVASKLGGLKLVATATKVSEVTKVVEAKRFCISGNTIVIDVESVEEAEKLRSELGEWVSR